MAAFSVVNKKIFLYPERYPSHLVVCSFGHSIDIYYILVVYPVQGGATADTEYQV